MLTQQATWHVFSRRSKPPIQPDRISRLERQNEGAKFFIFVQENRQQIRLLLSAVLGDGEIADEVSLTVFARAFKSFDGWREPRMELLRLCIAECGRFQWRALAAIHYRRNEAPDTSRASQCVLAAHLLQGLRLDHRVLLVLREVLALSPGQVAAVLGRPEESIRADIFDARRELVKSAKGTL